MDICHCRKLEHKPAQVGVEIEVGSLEGDARRKFQKAPDITQDAGITEQGFNVMWSPLSHVEATKENVKLQKRGWRHRKAQPVQHELSLTNDWHGGR